jgi:hypothetical protein
MTRETQKQDESRTLRTILDAIGLRPNSDPEYGEAPDFIIDVAGRRIGIEVTLFNRGTMTQDVPMRAVESEWERLYETAEKARKKSDDFRNLNVGVMFRDKVPPRKEHTHFIKEVFDFARAHRTRLSNRTMEFWPWDFQSPLLRTYLQTLYLRIDPYAQWFSNVTAGWVGRPDGAISAIVAEKSRKTYRSTDELWLAIQCTHRISETISDLMGVEDYVAVPSFADCIFSRVFVLTFTGHYEWNSTSGWRALARE